MIVADYIAKYLKKKKIKNIFMLTGYGAMYLNDSIKKEKIRYYATRNEATAPIMAAAYGRVKNEVGVACVTAGPGATNAIPGLAEAFVDSSPIIVISGQVDKKHTTISTKSKTIRTFGTAEINIEPIAANLTKFSKTILFKQTLSAPADIIFLTSFKFLIPPPTVKGIDVNFAYSSSFFKSKFLFCGEQSISNNIISSTSHFDINSIVYFGSPIGKCLSKL